MEEQEEEVEEFKDLHQRRTQGETLLITDPHPGLHLLCYPIQKEGRRRRRRGGEGFQDPSSMALCSRSLEASP